MLKPPYGEIADLLKLGNVVPFLGAGVNFTVRPRCTEWDPRCPYPPTGAELSHFLAKKASFPEENESADLSKVASYFVETVKRKRLRERLKEVFDQDFGLCDIHSYLAEVETCMLIVTTNYDDLTERAFDAKGRPYDLVIYPTDRKDIAASVLWRPHGTQELTPVLPNQLGRYIDMSKTTVIYKMHGTVDRRLGELGSYVITEEDYVDFLSRMTSQSAVPALFMEHFRTRSFLFIGYGLRDWNLRVMLKNLKAVLPRPEQGTAGASDACPGGEETASWAIQYSPTELEKALWNARGVKIYDLDVASFVQGLRA